MRDIKFRAWDKFFEEMYYFDFKNNIDVRNGILWINHKEGAISCQSPSVKLMQYTGLKDRGGIEIYEGDILELVNEAGERIKAVCNFGNRRLTTEHGATIDIQCFYFQIGDRRTNPVVVNYKGMHDLEIMEVRGNIYENPELLEV